MKKMNYALLVLLAFVLAGCSAYKQVPYLQASEFLDTSSQNTPLYDARIMPKDLLTITVNTTDPETAAPFNLTVATAVSNQNRSLTSQPVLQQYLVDNNGNIDFPVLGTLHIGGLTKSEAENLIREKLKTYITEAPIVNVRMANYKISVMGEVTKPGTFVITNEKVNLFEALAMAGDMTIYGQRDNVKLIRENAQGHREIIPLNMNDASIERHSRAEEFPSGLCAASVGAMICCMACSRKLSSREATSTLSKIGRRYLCSVYE